MIQNPTKFANVKYDEAEAGIPYVPQDKTLYIEQLTDVPPIKPGELFQPETMADVFEHYKPEKKGVEMLDQEGRPVREDFRFTAIKDFDDKQLIEQSPYLHQQKAIVDSYKSIEQQLIKNKVLRRAFEDEEGRRNLIAAMRALLAELEK